MFHDIPEAILERMRELEAIDALDRLDGTPLMKRLRQVVPETGRFLALVAAAAPQGELLEIGTSAGYSSLWISLACRARGTTLTTFEFWAEKALLAEETFRRTGVEPYIHLIQADARSQLADHKQVAFCFMDAEKDIYPTCYDLVAPNLVSGGFFLADNVISHAEQLDGFTQQVLADERVDAMVVPVGKGVLLCRKR